MTSPDAAVPDATSAEPQHRWHRFARALFRWLPGAIIVTVLVGAILAVADIEPPPRAAASANASTPLATPILSVRRVPAALPDVVNATRLDDLADRLQLALKSSPGNGCLSVRLGSRTIFGDRSDVALTPASTQKIITAAAALDVLGPEHRFRTDIRATVAPVGGVVHGDLTMIGGGDPVLMTADYPSRYRTAPTAITPVEHLADAIVGAGVNEVTGGVVGDDSRYDAVRYNPAWPPRFVLQNQTGPISALSVNDGFMSFQAAAAGGDGTDPAPDPAVFAAAKLTELLRARGVIVHGEATRGVASPEAVPLTSIDSPTILEIVGDLLGRSDNDAAEMLVKEVGLQRGGGPTFEAGSAVLAATVTDTGVDTTGLAIFGGSGLAERGTVTCDQLTAVLSNVDLSPQMAVAGESGTLRNRWKDTPLSGRLRGKTGTLNQVISLAGYVSTVAGDTLTFAHIVNVDPPAFVPREVFGVQQLIGEILVEFPGLVSQASLAPVPVAAG